MASVTLPLAPATRGRHRPAADIRGSSLALPEAATFEDLPGKWQAPILKAEQNLP